MRHFSSKAAVVLVLWHIQQHGMWPMEDLRQTSTGKTHSWTEEEISKNTDLSFLSFYHHFITIFSTQMCECFFFSHNNR